jgi:glutamine amidotransferase
MGWNRITCTKFHPIFNNVDLESEFYFVHSYVPAPRDLETIIATTDYGITFASVIAKRNLVAVQFHPEKSGTQGLRILTNFCLWDAEDNT